MKIQSPSFLKKLFSINSLQFKISVISLLLMYLPIVFKISFSRFNVTDTVPQLQTINTEVLKKLGTFTVRVNVGMFIKNFPVFDVTKNTFLVDSVIWFEFNGDEIMLETVEKFSIDNGKILYKSPPDIKMNKNRVFAKYNVLFELKSDLNFHKFPLEDHKLPIVLSNDFVTPDEMFFVIDASSFQLLPNIAPAGWKFRDTSVDAGFVRLKLDSQDPTKVTENPKALFVLNFIKASIRKLLVIFVPLYAASLLSLFSFVINIANTTGKFTLAVTALTALLGYRFVIEQVMPQVGYQTTTDSLYLFLLFFLFIIFSIQLLLTRNFMLTTTAKEKHLADPSERIEKISSIIFIVMAFLLAAATTYIIFM